MTLPLIIDNFAGGGGASTGIEAALGRPIDIAINHDEAAIAVHAANHPATRHYCQSIYSVDPLDATGGAPVLLAWFSPDCKHHSKAKGGKPREKYIRDMAWVVPHWIERLQRATPNGEGAPQVIMLENVEEFRKWGPIDPDGHPIKERAGEEFDLWLRRIRRLGYRVQHKELRACDYGAPTSRRRLFLIARRDRLPIVWPKPTHARPDSVEVRTGKLLPWRTAAECIDWSLPCPSIFDRKRDLKAATCRRIAAGVMRYVVNAARPFIVPLTHHGGPARVYAADAPLPTVTGAHRGEMAVVSPGIVPITHTKGTGQPSPAGAPLRTITTAKGGEFAVSAANLVKLRNHSDGEPIDAPLGAVTAGGQHHGVVESLMVPHVMTNRNSGKPHTGADEPTHTITAGGAHQNLVAAFLAQHNDMPRGGVHAGHPVNQPMSTITGRGTQQQMVETTLVTADALPADLLDRAVQTAAFLIKYYGNESGAHGLGAPIGTVTTKERFAVIIVIIDTLTYVLVDIGMRMLTPRELANAQGFPRDYILDPVCDYITDGGNRKHGPLPKSHQIAKIGNSVCPPMSEALVRANFPAQCVAQVRLAA